MEFILTSIRFGKQLTAQELNEIKAVVQARIAAFSRDDAETGYTTLIECKVDPLDKSHVQIRPYKLAFEEHRELLLRSLSSFQKKRPLRARTLIGRRQPSWC
jgi:hypothetical protein